MDRFRVLDLVLLMLAAALAQTQAQAENSMLILKSTAPPVSDGPCEFPTEVPVDADVMELYNPFHEYYIPRASEAFYRKVYEIRHGGASATSRAELLTLRPRAQFFTLDILKQFGDLEIFFDDDPNVWYGYRCTPSTLDDASFFDPLIPFLNVTCKYVGGAGGVMPEDQQSDLYLTLLWRDGTAANVWGCIDGLQSWHIISTEPELTPEQIASNDSLLRARGFDLAHAMDMKYTKTET